MWLGRLLFWVLGVVGILVGLVETASAVTKERGWQLPGGALTIALGVGWFLVAKLFDEVEALRQRVATLEQPAEQPAARSVPVQADPPVVATSAAAPDDREARALLAVAQEFHFSKQFARAKEQYAELVARYPESKQASVARQQLENLRNV